jgi:hypothetical protein
MSREWSGQQGRMACSRYMQAHAHGYMHTIQGAGKGGRQQVGSMVGCGLAHHTCVSDVALPIAVHALHPPSHGPWPIVLLRTSLLSYSGQLRCCWPSAHSPFLPISRSYIRCLRREGGTSGGAPSASVGRGGSALPRLSPPPRVTSSSTLYLHRQ